LVAICCLSMEDKLIMPDIELIARSTLAGGIVLLWSTISIMIYKAQ